MKQCLADNQRLQRDNISLTKALKELQLELNNKSANSDEEAQELLSEQVEDIPKKIDKHTQVTLMSDSEKEAEAELFRKMSELDRVNDEKTQQKNENLCLKMKIAEFESSSTTLPKRTAEKHMKNKLMIKKNLTKN